ncbi:MAG: phage virion morphogenesis protein [Rubrivivax sp.]
MTAGTIVEVGFDPLDMNHLIRRAELIERRTGERTALMRRVSGIMLDEVEENFAQQGRPRWVELRSVQVRRGAGYKILLDTGRLAASITTSFDAETARVGTNVVYARIHQFGGQTKPHVIRAKNKKALYTPFGPRKSVNHPGSKIPARPFLVITESGMQKIARAGEAFLRSVIA